MTNIRVDMTKQIRKIKPMHAGGQPPLQGNHYLDRHFHYLTEAGAPYANVIENNSIVLIEF